MAKSRITPEQKARRAQLGQLMAGAGIKSMEDIQELFKDMIASFVKQGLEGELDEELGYSKYDFRNKDTDNSRNGHSAIVGMSMDKNKRAELCRSSYLAAVHRYGKTKGMIVHSDHGSQYTSHLFRDCLKAEGARQSMGRTGSCYDNARMESFFATLKKELIYGLALSKLTREEVKALVFRWIECDYNTIRLLSQRRRRSTSSKTERLLCWKSSSLIRFSITFPAGLHREFITVPSSLPPPRSSFSASAATQSTAQATSPRRWRRKWRSTAAHPPAYVPSNGRNRRWAA